MRRFAVLVIMLFAGVACTDQPAEPVTLTLMAHESFAEAVDETTFAAFTEATGISVEVLASGDAGAMVNQAILTKDNPLADVLFGIDDTFLQRGLDEGLFESFVSEHLADIRPELLPATDVVTPVDFGDVCLNYDKEAFTAPPTTLDDLPEFADRLVVEDPSLSSPGLAFLLVTIERYGEEGWQDYWRELRDNGVLVAAGWTEAYYGEFSGGAGEGTRPLVVSYASSPPVEVLFSDPPVTEAPTGVITDGCYRQTEFAGVLTGTEHPDEAGMLIDFMLSPEFQATIPLTWFVYPANSTVELPEVFVEHSTVPDNAITMDPEIIEENRERWLTEWADLFA
ncbi:MAG: thiamine ABC transporter substrate-binding protein [Actinobacteria bacterium]|nr:thiamine ABC transporter substrate-binding protein [Actinomycetota bacterium]